MAVKKSELYSKLWESCNTLRSKGGMDATQYKDYVLIILFMKVITDKYYGKEDSIIIVPEDANFNTMVNLKWNRNIGEEFNTILAKIAEKNDLQDIIDVVDFGDENKLGKGKDMVDTLTGLIEIFQDPELNFSNNRADDDDILGDAYEYLMKKFASEAGKSKGQFYTPSEVSRVISKLIKIDKATKSPIYVYDMTCGSGSLLLKAASEAKEEIQVELYGQEKDINTAGLAVMNMFLHGNATATIKDGNTLTNPRFIENGQIRTFDYCVANPPFSVKKWSTDLEKSYDRFTLGMPPDSCADYAFLLHMLKSMDPETGRGAIILPHGVLFRGGQEEIIRKGLIRNGFIEGIIGLPANLFYGTGIPACIIILDKKDAKYRKNIFMMDASKDFVKDGNKNKLREEDIKKITDTYLNEIEEDKYSRIVPISEVKKQDYNLNIPRYINSSNTENFQDIKAHLLGGIPKIDIDKYEKYWSVAPNLKQELFKNDKKEEYYNLTIPKDKINYVISNADEIKKYSEELQKEIAKWKNNSKGILEKVNNSTRVKELIETISSDLLNIFEKDKLINKYDAYEYLMEYYIDTMKDDLHMIVDAGWIPKLKNKKDKNGRIKKNEFDSDLLPKQIVINEYFIKEYNEIEEKNNTLDSLIAEFDAIIEENTGDEGIFKEDEKINEKLLKEKLNEVNINEIEIIKTLINNLERQKELRKEIKIKQEELNKKIIQKYSTLDKQTSKELIINKKWYKSIDDIFSKQNENLIYELSNNITYEYSNYENTLEELTKKTSKLEKEILEDLRRMGYKC